MEKIQVFGSNHTSQICTALQFPEELLDAPIKRDSGQVECRLRKEIQELTVERRSRPYPCSRKRRDLTIRRVHSHDLAKPVGAVLVGPSPCSIERLAIVRPDW